MQAQELMQAARDAAAHASVPYSSFPVGAAVEAADGRVFRGCNIESASFGLTMCAERVALFTAVAAGARPIRIAVSCLRGDSANPASLTPCGACRQVMLDQMGAQASVIVDQVGEFAVRDLLPMGFELGTENRRSG